MDADPAAVALKFAFLGVLYLFLLVIARSALKDLRGRARSPAAEDGTGMHAIAGGRVAATDATLVAVQGGGLTPGERIDLFGGVTIGRSDQADVRIDDRFSSGIHCRVHTRGNVYLVEDMDSTNGTYLNGGELRGEAPLSDMDEIQIGDTVLRFELTLDEGHGLMLRIARGRPAHRHRSPARGQRGLVLLAGAAVRGRRRDGRRPGRRGRLADGGRGVRAGRDEADAAPEELLRRTAQEANREIFDLAQGDSSRSGWGRR